MMPPRGSEGLDFTPILTHYLFLFTSIVSIVAWFISFISQAIATAKYGHGSVGVLWFAIFLQLFLILGVLHTLASDAISMNRFQISVFGSVAIVFAVIGTNDGIFSPLASLIAMGAGWLITAIVDILWVLYFTSEEDSLMFYLFNSFGTGGLTPPSRRRRGARGTSVHNMSSPGNGYAAPYSSGGVVGPATYDSKIPRSGSFHADGVEPANRSIGAGSATNAPTSLAAAGSLRGDSTIGSPLMGAGAAGIGAGGGTQPMPGSPENVPAPDMFMYKAKALYSYTGSTEDPNEISFMKGEIVDIMDKQGKWWQARKADGTVGIAPSNYLQII